jgi:hypothetical protein
LLVHSFLHSFLPLIIHSFIHFLFIYSIRLSSCPSFLDPDNSIPVFKRHRGKPLAKQHHKILFSSDFKSAYQVDHIIVYKSLFFIQTIKLKNDHQ